MTVLKKKILLTVSFIMILGLVIFTSIKLVNVDAMSSSDTTKFKYYTSYEIKKGDTLTSIAENNIHEGPVSVSDYISEIKNINHLTSDEITSGKNIIIIYYSDEYK